jgi:glycosyltransferase involved in cell wall biosynthesis
MAQSRPVVSTACLGTRSVLTAESGAFVVPELVGEFAAAVAAVLKDGPRGRAMGEQGRVWAQRWSSREMARRMADFYSTVGAARGAEATPAVT